MLDLNPDLQDSKDCSPPLSASGSLATSLGTCGKFKLTKLVFVLKVAF